MPTLCGIWFYAIIDSAEPSDFLKKGRFRPKINSENKYKNTEMQHSRGLAQALLL